VQGITDLDKDFEEFVNHRRILIECCKLNGISPMRFIALSWATMVQEYKSNGKKIEDFEDMVGVCLKEAREMWDAMD
jgi:hypothetical protein